MTSRTSQSGTNKASGGAETEAAGWAPDPAALKGHVALVAGATRGAGRGVAAALGEAGATVLCTGRSSRNGSLRSDYGGRDETVEETAELVTSLGGEGVAIPVDHLDADQVAALAARVRGEFGRLDVLVNDIWGGELLTGGPAQWDTPLWELNLDDGLRLLRLAIDTHLITSHHLLPLLIERPGGLVVEVTDGTMAHNADRYRISVFYDLAKISVNRLAFSQGHELAAHGATAVALTPGWLRSEMMLEHFGVREDNWRDSLRPGPDGRPPSAPADFALSETPRFVGRAVTALATDPERARWNQRSVDAGSLAKEYGFTDVDGSRPDCWRYIEEVGERGLTADYADFR
ncbi:SDR family oxidoreductase [Streptomyces sp. NA04227]|uniref:SDR family oxidoreductase n=1 Tax=Streptomyces sp. NA04227 TaxID=2742136 RepID=UPI0015914B60|nr:SDR family oxidoreductase [Streptomyces sp. NA04227]QKW06673.1 SDR family oxidoreductase [Streptomyces sp. NA04227]